MQENDNLITIVEDYISKKRNGHTIDESLFIQRLQNLNKSKDEIHNIMIEMDDDCDKELLAIRGLKNAKTGIVLSIITCLALCTISILSALGVIFQGRVFILFYGGIAASFIYGTKCYYELTGSKNRKKRRELKWKNWQ